MSHKYISFCIVFLAIGLNAFCQKDYTLSFGAGIPIIGSLNWESFSYEVDASINKSISNHIALGLGADYLNNDKKREINSFSYDNSIFSVYAKTIYQINPRGKIKFQPEVRGGYAFYSSSLNEYQTDTEYDNGFLIGVGINVRIPLSEKVSLSPMINWSEILKKEQTPSIGIIPENYVYFPENIKIWEIGLGINIEL